MKTPILLDINLLPHAENLRIKREGGKRWVWDAVRKGWFVLTPEEFVRQLLYHYLVGEAGFNRNRIQVEKGLRVLGRERRFDLLVYDGDTRPHLLVECKRPEVPIDQKVFDQVALYNIELGVPYLLVTNGRHSYCCQVDAEKKDYRFLERLPDSAETENIPPDL